MVAKLFTDCLDSFSVFQTQEVSQNVDCVSLFSACHDNGTISDNTCNSYNAQCKDKCSVIYGTCLSSGSADDAQCMNQYNNCYDSFTPSTSVDCVSEFTICLDNGGEANTCASYSAQCKDKCSVSYSTCLASGDADDSACLTQYTGCLVSFDTVANSTSCATKYTTCETDGTTLDNECSAETATCKTNCATSYSTCLSSGDSTVLKPCLTQYSTCLDDFVLAANATAPGSDCVSKYLSCGGESNACGADNAQCKNSCSTLLDICNSSGDNSTSVACQSQYDTCLYDPTAVHTNVDCTTAYFSCDGDDNTCLATLATCKNTCSVALDTCQTSGDDAFEPQCTKLYDSCLFDATAATAAIGEDCVGEYLDCEASGTADNTCNANVAQCKNKCAQGYDTCNTSGNNSTAPACLRVYDSCLVSFSANETTAAGQDCESVKTACGLAGTADNVCNADYAQCKNKCATVLDTCSSSGDTTLLSMCDSLYNGCLSPVINTNITAPATEILSNITAALNSTLSNVTAVVLPIFTNSSALPTLAIALPTSTSTVGSLSTGVASAGTGLPTTLPGTGYFTNSTSTVEPASLTVVGHASVPTATIAASGIESTGSATATGSAAEPTETGEDDGEGEGEDDDGEGEGDDEDDEGTCPA